MSTAAEWVREAIAEHVRAESEETIARATSRAVDDAAVVAARARARMGTGEGREQLEEAVSTRALDEASHGALLDHVARIAEAEVLARRGIAPFPLVSERVVLEDRERSLGEIVAQARDPIPERARVAVAALEAHAARDRARRLEALAEAADRRARIRMRGPAAPDDARADLRDRCTSFLRETDEPAADLVARAHHALGVRTPSLGSLALALAPPPLDDLVGARGRAGRVAATFDALGLAAELRARVDVARSDVIAVAPRVAVHGTRATVLASAIEAGVVTERAHLAAVGEALARALVSSALPIEHRSPPRASVAVAIGALSGAWLADERWLARHVDASPAGRARVRVAATLALVLEARHACVAILAGPSGGRSDEGACELAARALGLDPSLVTPEIARSCWALPTDAETRVRAMLAALGWVPALRERYDEDFFRNPRLADFIRGAAARGGTVSAEAVSTELGIVPSAATRRVVELAERAGG